MTEKESELLRIKMAKHELDLLHVIYYDTRDFTRSDFEQHLSSRRDELDQKIKQLQKEKGEKQ